MGPPLKSENFTSNKHRHIGCLSKGNNMQCWRIVPRFKFGWAYLEIKPLTAYSESASLLLPLLDWWGKVHSQPGDRDLKHPAGFSQVAAWGICQPSGDIWSPTLASFPLPPPPFLMRVAISELGVTGRKRAVYAGQNFVLFQRNFWQ